MRLTFARARPRFLALYADGLLFVDIARRLGVRAGTVEGWAKAAGLPSRYDKCGPEAQRRNRRAQRAAAMRRGCDSLGEFFRQRRMKHYRAAGYPPGVTCRSAARAVDLARRLGGVTRPDLERSGLGRQNAYRVVRAMVEAGVLVPAGKSACRVATRRAVQVWRLDYRARAAGCE